MSIGLSMYWSNQDCGVFNSLFNLAMDLSRDLTSIYSTQNPEGFWIESERLRRSNSFDKSVYPMAGLSWGFLAGVSLNRRAELG